VNIETARLYIRQLEAAIDQAEAEGRTELRSDDIGVFADDAGNALAMLDNAIAQSEEDRQL